MPSARSRIAVCLLLFVSLFTPAVSADDPPPFDFTISVDPPAVEMDAPGRHPVTVTATAINGFQGPVSVRVRKPVRGMYVVTKDCPPSGGPHCTFETLTLNIDASGSASDQVLLSPAGNADSSQVVFVGSHGVLPEKEAIVDVTIRPRAPMDFALSIDPPVLTMDPSTQQPVTITAAGINGFQGAVNVKVRKTDADTHVLASNCPSSGGYDCSLQTLPLQIDASGSASGQVILSTGSNAQSSQLVFVGSHGVMPEKEVTLSLNVRAGAPPPPAAPAPAFTLSVDPAALQMDASGREPVRVTATGVHGFQGPVTVQVKSAAPGMRVVSRACPAAGDDGPQCAFESVVLHVDFSGTASEVVFLSPSADAQSSQVVFVGRHGALPERDATVDVTVRPAVQAPRETILQYRLSVDPAGLTLQPGESKVVTLSVDRGSFAGPLSLNASGGDWRVSAGVDGPGWVIPAGQTSRQLTFTTRPDAPPGRVEFTIRANPADGSAADLNRADAPAITIPVAIEAAPAPPAPEPPPPPQPAGDFTLSVTPDRITLNPTEVVGVTVSANRQGFEGPVEVVANAGSNYTVIPATFTLSPGADSKVVSVVAASINGDQVSGAYGDGTIDFKAVNPAGQQRKAEVSTRIVVPPPAPPPAPEPVPVLPVNFPAQSGRLKNRESGKCLTIENQTFDSHGREDGTRLVLEPCTNASDQLFHFGSNGEIMSMTSIGADGSSAPAPAKCVVIEGGAATDNARIILWGCSNAGNSNETWTLDAGNRLIGRVHHKCIEPAGGATPQNAIVRPCWDGANQQWTVVQQGFPPAAPPAPPASLAPAFTFTAAATNVEIVGVNAPPGAVHVFVEGADGWSGRVRVWAASHEWINVEPSDFVIDTGTGNGQLVVFSRRNHIAAVSGRVPPVVLNAQAEGGAGPTQTLSITINQDSNGKPTPRPGVRPGGGLRPGVHPDRPGMGEEPELEPDVPMPDLDAETAVHYAAVARLLAGDVARSNAFMDGLNSGRDDEPIIDPSRAAQQESLIALYSALMSELQSPSHFSGFPQQREEIELARIGRIIEASTGLHGTTARPPYQIASLATLPFYFAMELGSEHHGLGLPPKLNGNIPWRAYTPSEKLVQQIRLSRMAKDTQRISGPSRDVLDKLNGYAETLHLDVLPLPQLQAAIKGAAIAGAIATITDVTAKAAIAFMPDTVTALYTEINGVPRKEDTSPVAIRLNVNVPVKVFLETSSPGTTEVGPIATPAEIAEWIFNAVIGNSKVQAQLGKRLGGDQSRASAKMKEQITKDVVERVKSIYSKISGNPIVTRWLESHKDFLSVPRFDNPRVNINSKKVVFMKAISTRLLSIDAHADVFTIRGIHATKVDEEAGYHFGLSPDLREELIALKAMQDPESRRGNIHSQRKAVVTVSEDAPEAQCPGFISRKCGSKGTCWTHCDGGCYEAGTNTGLVPCS